MATWIPSILVIGGGALVVVAIIWLVAAYNGLVRLRNICDESWSNIDVELRQRYDLIPVLVQTVKGYAGHEKETLEGVIQARNTAMANHNSPAEQARDENLLVGCLRQLFALAENYPDLKANQSFGRLQDQLAETEDRIQDARRDYNRCVRDLNTAVESIPTNLVAGVFGFPQCEFFQIEDIAARQRPGLYGSAATLESDAKEAPAEEPSRIDWVELSKALVLDGGEIRDREAEILRRQLVADGKWDSEDFKFLAELRRDARKVSQAFDAFFFPILKKKVLMDGRIGDAEANWLQHHLFTDGRADAAEQKFMHEIKAEAKELGPAFVRMYDSMFRGT